MFDIGKDLKNRDFYLNKLIAFQDNISYHKNAPFNNTLVYVSMIC